MSSTAGYMYHVKACTAHDPRAFVPFIAGGKEVGCIRRDSLDLLAAQEGFLCSEGQVVLHPHQDDEQARTVALRRAASRLAMHHKMFLHGEVYPVIARWGDEPVAQIDRAAIPWFGVKGCGVHVNGIVRKKDGLHYWIGERSLTCRIDPGRLDLMIGGGLPLGLSIQENLRKEAWEEAGVNTALADQSVATGPLSYRVDMMMGVRNDTLFTHDLDLPESFTPQNTDGEVGRFMLLPASEVAHIIRTTTNRFKFNCNLVLIDALLRHNMISPEDSEFDDVLRVMKKLRHL